jgi:hypothetical protein
MSGSIAFDVSHIGNCQQEEKLAWTFVDRIKEIAADRDVKVPKHIRYGGMYGSSIYVYYNTNAVKDLILLVGRELNLTVKDPL